MRKTFFTFGAIVAIAVGIAIYFVIFRFDSVLESRIERAATIAMGSHVEVHGVKTSLRDGTLTVEQVSVANPPGFKNPHAARFNGLEAAVDYDQREIKRVVIDRPEFIIEEANGKTNFQQMLESLEAAGGPGEGDGTTEEPVIVLRHFRINETHASFESETLDRYTDVDVDAIELNNLRGTPSELAGQIARAVVKEVSSEAATEMLKAQARKQFKDAGDVVSRKFRDLIGDDDDASPETVEESADGTSD